MSQDRAIALQPGQQSETLSKKKRMYSGKQLPSVPHKWQSYYHLLKIITMSAIILNAMSLIRIHARTMEKKSQVAVPPIRPGSHGVRPHLLRNCSGLERAVFILPRAHLYFSSLMFREKI